MKGKVTHNKKNAILRSLEFNKNIKKPKKYKVYSSFKELFKDKERNFEKVRT